MLSVKLLYEDIKLYRNIIEKKIMSIIRRYKITSKYYREKNYVKLSYEDETLYRNYLKEKKKVFLFFKTNRVQTSIKFCS